MEKNDILKKCRAYNRSNDILYYLIRKKQADTYAVVLAPCNYLYQNDKDQFFGTCIYMSENNLSNAMRCDFTDRRELFGIPMVKIAEKTENGKKVFLDSWQIRALPFRCRMDSAPRFSSPFYPSYTCFECEDVVDIIEPRAARMNLFLRDGEFRTFLTRLTERLEIMPEQVGITGSAALGVDSPNDYDIIFYGDREELRRINSILLEINRSNGIPNVFGMPLPFRFIFENRVIDTLFVDEDPELNNLYTARQIRTEVPFSCRVTDDTAALQVEPFLRVDSKEFSSLIIMETFFHGVIRKGNVIEGTGDLLSWEHDGKEEYVMMCREPFRQLKDYTRYFFQFE